MEGRMGVARLGSLSVDDMALARDRERQSPRGASGVGGFLLADPIQDDLTKALERLNEAENEYARFIESMKNQPYFFRSKRSSVHVSPPAPRKLVSAHNSVAYWQGISPEETLRHILDYVHDHLVVTNELSGNVKVVLTYAGTEVWLLVPLNSTSDPLQRTQVGSEAQTDPLHAAKIASIRKDTERAVARLLRVVDRMAAAMPDYGGASLVGTQVTYRVFGYEVRIEIEAGAQSIRNFTAARRKPAKTGDVTVDTSGLGKASAENSPRVAVLNSKSEPRFILNDDDTSDLLGLNVSPTHRVCVTPPIEEE